MPEARAPAKFYVGYSLWYDVILVDNIHDNINVLDSALWAETILKLNVFLCNLKQEAQLSQRDCATLRVIEYFAR